MPPSQGTTINALRRFSSFVTLRKQLADECPVRILLAPSHVRRRDSHLTPNLLSLPAPTKQEYRSHLPSLPPRRAGLLQKYAARYLEERRKALQRWLEIVMLDRRWGGAKALREWVVGTD